MKLSICYTAARVRTEYRVGIRVYPTLSFSVVRFRSRLFRVCVYKGEKTKSYYNNIRVYARVYNDIQVENVRYYIIIIIISGSSIIV